MLDQNPKPVNVAEEDPSPKITSLSPTAGPLGVFVTITGVNFGASQGPSAVTFNGMPAKVASWSETRIVAPVPPETTTGNVIVTARGETSNEALFTVRKSLLRD